LQGGGRKIKSLAHRSLEDGEKEWNPKMRLKQIHCPVTYGYQGSKPN